MFLRNDRVFREPRTKWLQLEPVDSALALTGQAGLKVDDHFFTVYDVPAARLAIIGWRAGTRGTHRTRVLVYNPPERSSWSAVLPAFPSLFLQKYVFHVFCVFSQRKFANVVCSVMCSNVFTGEMAGIISSPFAPLAPPVEQTEHRSSPYDMSDPMPDYENVYTD